MSSGLMFDDIIMNTLGNKGDNQHVEVVDIYFTKTEDSNIFMWIGSLQYFYWKKDTSESLDVVSLPHNV